MRHERHVSPPADRLGRVRRAGRRFVGQRRDVRRQPGACRGREQRRAERQHAAAVAGRAFGEDHHAVSRAQALVEDRQHAQQVALARAVEEDGPERAAEPADQRPRRDLGLRDEGRAHGRPEHDHVEVAQVVRDQEERPPRRRAGRLDAEADDACGHPRPGTEGRRAETRPAVARERRRQGDHRYRERRRAEPAREQERPHRAAQPSGHARASPGRKRARLFGSRSSRSNSTR